MSEHVCAVDVGTGSARAGIFSADGTLLGRATHPIVLERPAAGLAEHDSQDIWKAVCASVRGALAEAGVEPGSVRAIGFDATCSLVIRDAGGKPVSVSPGGPDNLDTICWMDHRGHAEAGECTRTGHRVLDYIGGVMSPEMQTPKLMWLKRHNPDGWARMAFAFDLADFLTWKATGSNARSQCTVTAKWTFLAHDGGWQRDFFAALGLDDVFGRTGADAQVMAPGGVIGPLQAGAAAELGLTTGCVVAAGLIDAFAGALGVIGGHAGEEIDRHMALIAGTSSCMMALAPDPRPASGVWGPYFGAAMPGYWLSEGGQSATGALLDHVVAQFGGGLAPDAATHERIGRRLEDLLAREGPGLARDLHVLPDFHGNRTPHADPAPAGVLSGLSLDSSFDGLCRLYWRTSVAIALGVREILEHMNAHGYRIDTLHLTGGHAKSALMTALYADASGCRLSVPQGNDAVLLGSAMNAASAAGLHGDLAGACRAMTGTPQVIEPDPQRMRAYDRDYRIFQRMRAHRKELLAL